MNEKKLEQMIREEYRSETPEFWDRIAADLPEKKAVIAEEKKTDPFNGRKTEIKMDRGFWLRKAGWKKALAAAAVFLVCLGMGMARMNLASRDSAYSSSYAGNMKEEYSNSGWGMAAGGYASDSAAAVTEEAAFDYEEYPEAAPSLEEGATTLSGDVPKTENRKLIYTYNMTLETLEFDSLLEEIQKSVQAMGGYLEYSDIGGVSLNRKGTRTASFTIRIPGSTSEAFRTQLGEMGNIRYSSSSAEDITLQYSDTKSRIETLRKEQDRLLAFMDEADTMSDIIEIERRLSEISYELESYEGRIRSYDNKVDYDTIHLQIEEVEVITPTEEPGFFETLGDTFLDSLEGLGILIQGSIILLVGSLPYLVFFAIVIIVIRIIWKRFRKC